MTRSSLRIERPHRFLSRRFKLLFIFSMLFVAIFGVAYYWFYTFATQIALNQIAGELEDTLKAAAARADGDVLVSLYNDAKAVERSDGFTDDPRYWDNLAWLEEVHFIEPRGWPGTYIRDGDQLVFLTDLWANYDPDKAAKFREVCDPDPEICGDPTINFDALGGNIQVDLNPYRDQWGYWVSGYAPIYGQDGQVVAGMFLDFTAEYVLQVQNQVRDGVVLAFAISFPIMVVLVYVSSNSFTSSTIRLTRAVERIAEGDYEVDMSHVTRSYFPDENDILATVFGVMVNRVRGREQALLRRVEELEIKFDETRRRAEVREIVTSEFFHILRSKAQSMRDRIRQLAGGSL